jgi:type IV pilus assembly protein PilY1
MAFRPTKSLAIASLIILGAAGYYLYAAIAQTAPPQLAQGPLNTSRTIQPAFIMAVDDSGSMDFETLFPTNDGSAWWHSGNDSFTGLNRDDSAVTGVLNFNRAGNADNTWKKYPYLFPFGSDSAGDGPRNNAENTNDHFAIPPIPAYGWARSPDINSAYFDPLESYQPWMESTGQFLQGVAGIDASTGQVSPTSAPADPKRGATRLNLTADFVFTGTNARFMFYGGMAIPQGTRYRDVNCSDGGAVQNTNADVTGADGFKVAGANRNITQNSAISRCGVAIRHYPAIFYVLSSRAAAVATEIGYNPVAIIDDGARAPNGAELRRFEIKSANFSGGNYTSTINNFANWFSYYRKRHQAARAGLTLAFADQNLKIRAGYFQINNRNTVNMRRMNVAADRALLYDSLFGLNSNGGTPNKEAVKHMGDQFRRSYVEGSSPVQLSCQKNYGMLFTDGFSNVWDGAGVNNVDGGDATLFPSPLGDTASNTMADIAAYYYKNSLGTSFPPAAGRVAVDAGCSATNPDPRLDCQTVPHMNLYGVTLGAQGLIYGSPGFENQTSDPYANPPTWPTQFYARHPSAVDDLWHATLNARGEFINASSSGALVAAIRQVVSAVTEGASTSGSFALTGSRVGVGSLTVEPFYEAVDSTDWYGKLTARTVTANPVTGEVSRAFAWEAGEELPAHADRDIKFGRPGTGVVPTVRDFTSAGLAEAGITTLAPLCSGTLAPAACTAANLTALGVSFDDAVAYLRGNDVLEGNGLRARSAILGDIINSSPVISTPKDDYGYRSLGGSLGTTYATYLQAKNTANKSAVFVGANDGMFHAFDGDSGEELFAYIPSTALGHLGNLLFPREDDANATQKFDHRYYVDGQITVSDVFMGGSWKTVAIVAAGAGGRGVVAFDVTNPNSISVLWEINDLITGNATLANQIGHVLGKPVIVPTKAADGTVSWKAIFGNGFNSQSQNAVLFVVDIASGSVQAIAAAEASSSDVADYNGLGNIVVLDRRRRVGADILGGRDGYADTVYAGDQNGAVWKFDLLAGSVALGGNPFFIARDASGNRQPITGGLEAAAGPGASVMIYFGTGSFAFEGDGTSLAQQTLYAVADRGVAVSGGRGALLRQTVGTDVDGYRSTSTNAMAAAYAGWYIDLPTGERFVGNPRIESGIIFFPSYKPSGEDTNPCLPGGTNWLYGLNALSGGAALTQVRIGSPTGPSPSTATGAIALVVEGDGSAPITDVGVFTTPRVSPVTNPDELDEALAARCSMVVQVSGAKPLYLPRPCGRQSWRQVR